MQSFDEAWASFSPGLPSWLRNHNHARQDEDAEDIAQETAVRALKDWASRRDGPPGPWLYRVAIHAAADYYRSPSTRPIPRADPDDVESLIAAGAEESAGAASAQATLEPVFAELLKLPMEERCVFYLRYFLHGTPRQIGAWLNKRTGAVRVLLHRMRKKLIGRAFGVSVNPVRNPGQPRIPDFQ
ncbi:MAG: hypothetical protein FD180_5215 [Planctomycetota bacterium]|nr:MAG: hypothetical protein FD180_5215 [Planctomycetota bacterium]